MSVRTYYETLITRQSHVKKSLKEEKEKLYALHQSYDILLIKSEELLERSSRLAVSLTNETSDKILEIESRISQVNENISKLESELHKLKTDIISQADDAKPYIDEQSDLMVKKLLDFVSDNELNLVLIILVVIVFLLVT